MSDERDRIRAAYRRRIERGVVDRYAPSNPGERFMLRRREEDIIRLLARNGIAELATRRILEVGCGRGTSLAHWLRLGASPGNLHGIDLMEPFVRQAADLLPGARFAVSAADTLPFADGRFDVVSQLTMFTSILDDRVRQATAAEMRRVLAPDGAILWYDFRYPSPRNPDVRPVTLPEIRTLFPGWTIDAVTTTLLPPLARRLAGLSVAACRVLETTLPPLRSHYLAVLRRPGR
jgi:ubiquinone/menaquinone biosynthesis C-methylase UbiE